MRKQEVNFLTEVIDRSVEFQLHPLGFFYLKDDISLTTSRRVHVWLQQNDLRRENDTHQHSYSIDSIVVTGKMRNELFRYNEAAKGPTLEFQVSYEAEKSILRSTGRRGNLKAIASFETFKGTRYQLEAGVIHRVTVEEVPCVTVLTTIERGLPIYSYGRVDNEQPFARRMVSSGEAQAVAMILAGQIRSHG